MIDVEYFICVILSSIQLLTNGTRNQYLYEKICEPMEVGHFLYNIFYSNFTYWYLQSKPKKDNDRVTFPCYYCLLLDPISKKDNLYRHAQNLYIFYKIIIFEHKCKKLVNINSFG